MGSEAKPIASPVVSLSRVRVSLGGRIIQDDMSFTIQDGEYIAALGLGLLFLALYSGYAARVYGILFGNILGISAQAVRMTAVASGRILAMVVFLYRPLLFST